MRLLQLIGISYAAVCGALALKAMRPSAAAPAPSPVNTPIEAPAEPPTTAEGWFQGMKPFCNALEVVTRVRMSPPPEGLEGAGYAAACYALAGNIDSARATILRLPPDARGGAAGIVFGIGHPVADDGDDRSAGPIMELVIEFQPDNYMALYHAGMSEYALGQHDRARGSLARFIELYQEPDGWRGNALEVLGRIKRASP